MSFTGILLAESLDDQASFVPPALTVRRIWRDEAGDPSVGQPAVWTFIEFEIDDEDADALVDALRRALAPGPWYCDFRSGVETIVVFSGQAFRYPRGDAAGRTAARQFARTAGVPESQIDWPD